MVPKAGAAQDPGGVRDDVRWHATGAGRDGKAVVQHPCVGEHDPGGVGKAETMSMLVQ